GSSRLLDACRALPVDATPVWFMRQAGRYLPRYQALRQRVSMLEALRSPELAAEITLLPFEVLDVDAAILFSDIMTPLLGMGMALDFIEGEGPRIFSPVRTEESVAALRTLPAEEATPYVFETIHLAIPQLAARGVPLIGFAGAPFTLASYAIEGGSSRNYESTKGMMWSEPALWRQLMGKLVTCLADYLTAQVRAGASVLQVFDSWAGALSPQDYECNVAPFNRVLIQTVQEAAGVPVIYFSTGTSAYLDHVASLGSDVVGVDWRIALGRARRELGVSRPVQGNLDPVALSADWGTVRVATDRVLAQVDGQTGHIFNLGHGILPGTPVDTVRRLVDYVHERSAR
ncbi:MAG: uroporphyrinogen decarboxylase, partial [Chloroflexi bacterium]|nr:uroporphyrinogen decarboxylase [Chloroflexota bacterium]